MVCVVTRLFRLPQTKRAPNPARRPGAPLSLTSADASCRWSYKPAGRNVHDLRANHLLDFVIEALRSVLYTVAHGIFSLLKIFARAERPFQNLECSHPATSIGTREHLSRRRAQRQRETRRIRVEFALMHRRLPVHVQKVDGVLDGDDVASLLGVDLVDQRRKRRGS
jgi:hypothetical protein